GERVELAGIMRATGVPSGTLGLTQADTASVIVRAPGAAGRIYQEETALSATGVFSTGLALPASAPPGTYTVFATVAGASAQANFVVQPDDLASLLVAIHTPTAPLVAGASAPLDVTVHTPEGLPVAGATISWTLDAARAPF